MVYSFKCIFCMRESCALVSYRIIADDVLALAIALSIDRQDDSMRSADLQRSHLERQHTMYSRGLRVVAQAPQTQNQDAMGKLLNLATVLVDQTFQLVPLRAHRRRGQ